MATGSWTEADVAAHLRKLEQAKPTLQAARRMPQGRPETAQGSTNALQTPIRPLKGHKYRAKPCLVGPDLTLYTKEDIDALDDADLSRLARQEGTAGFIRELKKQPLKERAETHGILDTIWFGSLKEGRRWIELKRLEAIGEVRYLRRQSPFELDVNGIRIGIWKADFVYTERVPETTATIQWREITEDAKGKVLPLDKWKRAHTEAQYQITIRIT